MAIFRKTSDWQPMPSESQRQRYFWPILVSFYKAGSVCWNYAVEKISKILLLRLPTIVAVNNQCDQMRYYCSIFGHLQQGEFDK